MLRILEEKLKSIPGIEAAPAPTNMPLQPALVSAGESIVQAAAVAAPVAAPAALAAAPAVPPAAPAQIVLIEAQAVTDGETEAPVVDQLPSLKDDPRYAKYFTMLKFNIPLVQVQQKMQMDGVDPSILSHDGSGSGSGSGGGGGGNVSRVSAAPPIVPSVSSSEVSVALEVPELPPPSDVSARPPPPPPQIMKEAEDPLVAAVARRAKKMAEQQQQQEGGSNGNVSLDGPLPSVPAVNLSRSSFAIDLDATPPPVPRDDSFRSEDGDREVLAPPPPPHLGSVIEDDEFDEDDDDDEVSSVSQGVAAPFIPPPPPIARGDESFDDDDSF
jgi:hypothetical protein